MKVDRPDPKVLGRRLQKLRMDAGKSQEQVAGPAYTSAYLSHVEHGKRQPSNEALTHFASQLGLSVEQLLSGRDPNEDLKLEVATQKAVADIHMGKAEEALVSLESTRERAMKLKNDRLLEVVESAMGGALFRLGRLDEAMASFDRSIALAMDVAPERRTTAIAGKARCLLHKGEARAAIHLLESHLIELEQSPETDPGCVVETYAALIPGYFETGMMDMASKAATRGWELASQTPDAARRACLHVNRANLLATQGNHRDAMASLTLAEDLYRHLGWYAEVVKVSLARSFALAEEGQWVEAEELIRKGLDAPGAVVSKADRIRLLTRLGFVRRQNGDTEEAMTHLRSAIEHAGNDFPTSVAEAERELGLCLLGSDVSQALDCFWSALKKFKESDDAEEAAKTARLLGDHLLETGDAMGAATAFREGLSFAGATS